MHYVDEAKIYVKAGKGGDGITSFRREKFIEFGGPDGGNGGAGGSVVFVGSSHLNTLLDFKYKRHFTADNGKRGGGRNCTGASGSTIYINVPLGTQILTEDEETVIADITEHDESVLIAKGGNGGLGNINFKSSTNRAPRKSKKGFAGDEICVWLKLKVLSDVGIIGLPNAGKSSFLSAVSAARPKIAAYPFTTLKPQLGVVRVANLRIPKSDTQIIDKSISQSRLSESVCVSDDDLIIKDITSEASTSQLNDNFNGDFNGDFNEILMADIPGLIKGASIGLGLGQRFLKHIERCKVLLHIIDITNSDIIDAYNTIRSELDAFCANSYSATVNSKPEIVVLNKIDCVDKETAINKKIELENYLKSYNLKKSDTTFITHTSYDKAHIKLNAKKDVTDMNEVLPCCNNSLLQLNHTKTGILLKIEDEVTNTDEEAAIKDRQIEQQESKESKIKKTDIAKISLELNSFNDSNGRDANEDVTFCCSQKHKTVFMCSVGVNKNGITDILRYLSILTNAAS